MKIIKGKQQFKTVSAKQAESNPALLARVGKKRAQVEFDLPCWEKSDLESLVASNGTLLLTCLNNAIADLAKAKFAENGTNWEFLPSVESDLSLEALAASFESTSRGRILTNENAGKLVEWISKNSGAIVSGIQLVDSSYTTTQLLAICTVMTQFTAYATKPRATLDKVLLRMEQISEAIMSNESLTESFIEDSSLAEVYDALIKKFTKVDEVEITADAL